MTREQKRLGVASLSPEERARVLALQRRSRAKLKERRAAQCRQYRAKMTEEQREAAREYSRLYHRRNRERSREWDRAWKERNAAKVRERMRAYSKRFRQKHPERIAQNASKRRALKAKTRIGRVSFKAILEKSRGLCGICRKPLDLFGIHYDHIIPLSKGGTHTEDNMQATHAWCNSKKSDKMPERSEDRTGGVQGVGKTGVAA